MNDRHDPIPPTLPPAVRLAKGAGSLPAVDVDSRLATAQVYLNGAHLAAWQPRQARAPVLWMSRASRFEAGKPLRGGVPVCFPWFAVHAADKTAPSHGFARICDWTMSSATESADGGVVLVFDLASDVPPSPAWPHAFRASYRISVGATLAMSLEVRNPGTAPFTFEEALHAYFAVRDVREVRVRGLAGVDYLDKVAGFARRREGHDPIRITAETDRIYLSTQATCTIEDPVMCRRISIAKTGSNTTVVWNPWVDRARTLPDFGDLEWQDMLCIETCNVNAHAVTLAPGDSHSMTAAIEVAALA